MLLKQLCLGMAILLLLTPIAQAQVGRVLKEGAEVVGKQVFSKTAREVVEEGTERMLKKVITEAGQESAEAVAKRAGIKAVRYTDDIANVVGKHGGSVAAPLVNRFGDEGAKALSKLSATNARRMAMLTEEFAAHGRGTEWMKLLAKNGDVAAEWIWKNKGTVAVAATTTAFLANPDPFLNAGEKVLTKTLETTGQHVAEPMIERLLPVAAEQVSSAIANPAATMVKTRSSRFWPLLLGSGLLLGLCYGSYRWYGSLLSRMTGF